MNRYWVTIFAILLMGIRNEPASAWAEPEPRRAEIESAASTLRTSIRERDINAVLQAVVKIRVNQGQERAVQTVREVLKDGVEPKVHVVLLLALSECGVPAEYELPLLAEALKNPD